MPKELDVTVVIPNYNHAHFLSECVHAILSQTHIPKEILLIDNASSDNSISVIRDLKQKYSQVVFIQNTTNQGPVTAYNYGIRVATGRYIALCAADDLLLPGFFQQCVELLDKHPDMGACCSDPSFFKNEKPYQFIRQSLTHLEKVTPIPPNIIVQKFILSPLWIPSHASLFRRKCVIECNAYPESLHHIADWYLNVKLAITYGVVYVPSSLGAFRLSSNSYGARLNRNYRRKIEIYKNLFQILKIESKKFQTQFKRAGVLGHLSADIMVFLLFHPHLWSYIPFCFFRKCSNLIRKIRLL